MDSAILARLLGSLEAGRLVVICGAGLSMAPPSSLPSAKQVANTCYDNYKLAADQACDSALRDDLEALAEHFEGLRTLRSVFIDSLVPWPEFVRPSNPGPQSVGSTKMSIIESIQLLYESQIALDAAIQLTKSRVRDVIRGRASRSNTHDSGMRLGDGG
jgi:hypothetical protein